MERVRRNAHFDEPIIMLLLAATVGQLLASVAYRSNGLRISDSAI